VSVYLTLAMYLPMVKVIYPIDYTTNPLAALFLQRLAKRTVRRGKSMRSRQVRVGNRVLPSIVGKLGAIVLAALYLAVQTPAAATPLTYTLSNATATFPQGTVNLSGTFTIDPQTGIPSNVDVTATGPVPPLAQ
jgi:hypothetical protein